MSSASILSVSRESSPSISFTSRRRTARGGGSSCSQSFISLDSRISASPSSGIARVTNTFGFICGPGIYWFDMHKPKIVPQRTNDKGQIAALALHGLEKIDAAQRFDRFLSDAQ